MAEAFRIILSDEKVQGVLVNIFGGVCSATKLPEPLWRRPEKSDQCAAGGPTRRNNVGAAREVLEAAKADIPNMQVATDLEDAAAKVCAAVA